MVRRLSKLDFTQADLQEHFPDNKLVTRFQGLKPEQVKHLEGEGYVLCPDFFTEIGIPSARTKLSTIDQAALNKPKNPLYEAKKLAESHGISVSCELKEADSAIDLIPTELKDQITELKVAEGYIDIEFAKVKLSKDELSHPLPNPKTKEQKVLKAIRSLILCGLSNEFFDEAITVAGGYLTTYDTGYDLVTEEETLNARNSEYTDDSYLKLRIKASPEKIAKLSKAFLKESTSVDLGEIPNEPETDNADTTKKLQEVPVEQPNGTELKPSEIVLGEVDEDAVTAKERLLAAVTEQLPQLAKHLNQVNALLPEQKTTVSSGNPVIDQYLQWREGSEGQYEGITGGISGEGLTSIIGEFNEADIATIAKEATAKDGPLNQLGSLLKQALDKLSSPDTEVDHFEITSNPTELQIRRLSLLRGYVELTSGIEIPNDLFIYEGTGSKGINIAQKAIGLNSALFDETFEEALSTFIHEVAHNHSMDHNYPFMHAMQSLFVKIHQKRTELIGKIQSGGGELTASDKLILSMLDQWE